VNRSFRPIVARALIVVSCVAAGAAAVTPASAFPTIATAPRISAQPRQTTRVVHRAGIAAMAVIPKPMGCVVNGEPDFIGVGPSSAFLNYAASFSGVVAGNQNEACDYYTVVGGGRQNIVGGEGASTNSMIAGGAQNGMDFTTFGFIGGGSDNLIGGAQPYAMALSSVIGGGDFNSIGSPSDFIGTGEHNTIASNAVAPNGEFQASFIGAGYNNTVSGNSAGIVSGLDNSVAANYATVVGGASNSVGLLATYGVVSGGQSNTVSGEFGAVGGGFGDAASGAYAMVAGGHMNVASGLSAAVGGGLQNVASGMRATIPGGETNVASGTDSFAAGTSSNAATTGSFVWSDDATGAKTLKSTVANEFMARATGGFYLYSSANPAAGVKLAPGSGSWSTLSDRTVKTAIVDIDPGRVLAKVATLPISEWSYSAEGTGVRHLGPMAQDFYAAFGLGEDDRHIATVDEEGIALAAIKALHADVRARDRQLAGLDAKMSRLEQRLDAIGRTAMK
jgi:hypothetical protein